VAFKLNYDEWIHLDSEDLAEAGIKHAYTKLGPALSKYIHSPAELREEIDNDAPRYSVMCLGREYSSMEATKRTIAGGAPRSLYSTS
jgi:hypothetical protein